MKMNILICDDMKFESTLLADLIAETNFDVNINVFNDAQEALAFIRTSAALDVCFLDILMPEMTGIELADALRSGGYTGFIVFLTSVNNYAPESYRVKAFDYIMKPATLERVKEVLVELDKAIKNADKSGMLIKSAGVSRTILFREISHLEVIHNIVNIRLIDGSIHKTRATLAELAPKLLADKRFIQSHRSFIVNTNFIAALRGNSFFLQDGTEVPISRSHSSAKDMYITSPSAVKEDI